MSQVILKYRHLSSVLLIEDKIGDPASFSFDKASIETQFNIINTKKASAFENIPPKILIASKISYSETLTELFHKT